MDKIEIMYMTTYYHFRTTSYAVLLTPFPESRMDNDAINNKIGA